MIISAPPPPTELADVLIVGAGAVGLALGLELAAKGARVVMVESGGPHPVADYQRLNDGVQAGDRHHKGLLAGRYMGLGGTTRLWGGQLMSFAPADFLADSLLNKPGWPIAYADVAPWIDVALHRLGIAGGQAGVEAEWDGKAARSAPLGPNLQFASSVWMRQPDLTAFWRERINSAAGPRILLGHEAIGLSVDPARGHVDGLRLRTADGTETIIRARETVLACGTIENAHLLLRAQASLPQTPLGRNRQVGQWFVDHLHGVAGEIHPHDRDALGNLFDTSFAGGRKILPKLRLSDRTIVEQNLPNCAVTVNSAFGLGEAMREMRGLGGRIFGGGTGTRMQVLRDSANIARMTLPLVWRYLSSRRSAKFLSGNPGLGIEVEQVPTRASYLYLEPGVPADHARIGLHWSLDGVEMRSIEKLTGAVDIFFREAGLGTLALDPLIARRDSAFFDRCHDSSHQIGGARMAHNAEDGVVDPHCQVHGMPGLWVAGAAVFPSGSFANPTLTAIALSLRLAEHLTTRKAR